MAGRKIKEGLNYFRTDIDFFDDLKILKIEEEYNILGSYIALRLLCWIYRNGYYLNWSDEDSVTYAKKIGNNITSTRLQEVVFKLIKVGFFDEELYKQHSILTSHGIQSRWFDINGLLKRSGEINPLYNLLDGKKEEKPKKQETIKEIQEEIPKKQEEIIEKTELMHTKKRKKGKEEKEGKEIQHEISSEKLKKITVPEDEETEYKIPEKLKKIPGFVELFERYMRLRNEQYRPLHPIQVEGLLMELLPFKDPMKAVSRALTGNASSKVYMHFFETDDGNSIGNQPNVLYAHLRPPSEIDMRD